MAHNGNRKDDEDTSPEYVFRGKRFWLSRRLPMRDHFLRLVKDNGGEVAPLEKNADFLIADPMRRDQPPGSYSYKFIEDSVRSGALQLEDRYLIGPDPDFHRPTGSSVPGKKTRAKFAKEEDALLAHWVLSHPAGRAGNSIYQDFELQCPSHTWQSWRSRWVNKLSLLSPDQLQRLADSAPELPDRTQEDGRVTHGRPTNQISAEERNSTSPVDETESDDAQPQPQQAELPDLPQQNAWLEGPAQSGQSEHPEAEEEEEEEEYADTQVQKAQFQADINVFAQQQGRVISQNQTIADKTFSLFALTGAVARQEVDAEDIDWVMVAEDLGFADNRLEVSTKLQVCWQENLADFLEAMEEYGEQDEEGSAQPIVEDAAEAPRIVEETPASVSRGKRLLSQVSSSSPSSSAKRRKAGRDAEIPSTPDAALRVVRHSSPPDPRRQLFSPAEVRDSQEDSQAISTRRRATYGAAPAARSPILGLATPSRPALRAHETSFNLTPSQQLRDELEFASSPAAELMEAGRRQRATSSSDDDGSHRLSRGPKSTPGINTRGQRFTDPTSPFAQPVPKKAVRRSLPHSFTANHGSPKQQQPPPPPPAVRSPELAAPLEADTHDPDNDGSAQPPRRDEAKLDTLEDWVDHYQSMGYPHDIVIKALEATTLTPGGPAAHAMEFLRSGRGLPTNYEGVWTDGDDAALSRIARAAAGGDLDREPSDARELAALRGARMDNAKLMAKHGEDSMLLRSRFLRAMYEG